MAFLSQSGGMSIDLAHLGKWMGLRFSKVVSFGNGADLREAELLRYLAGDPETGVIAMYVEGVADGGDFFDAIREAGRRKPVVVLKGGLSEAGGRAVVGHTASMGGSRAIWSGVLRQVNAVQVHDLEETGPGLPGLLPAAAPGLPGDLLHRGRRGAGGRRRRRRRGLRHRRARLPRRPAAADRGPPPPARVERPQPHRRGQPLRPPGGAGPGAAPGRRGRPGGTAGADLAALPLQVPGPGHGGAGGRPSPRSPSWPRRWPPRPPTPASRW